VAVIPPSSIPLDRASFRWSGIDAEAYKLRVGDVRGMGWKGVTRHTIGAAERLGTAFETRYFELEPHGYSSLEKHRHVHLVFAVRGRGRALVGDAMFDFADLDAVYVPPFIPHRWLNAGEEPFGFLCTVDAERDAPVPLDDDEWAALRANPATAPYVF
jgi:quercetin dioxygenase-like cupin family protein